MRLINRDALNEKLEEVLDRIKSKGVEPTWDDAMYVIDMIDDAHDERRMKEVPQGIPMAERKDEDEKEMEKLQTGTNAE